jgi:hypothetical protein
MLGRCNNVELGRVSEVSKERVISIFSVEEMEAGDSSETSATQPTSTRFEHPKAGSTSTELIVGVHTHKKKSCVRSSINQSCIMSALKEYKLSRLQNGNMLTT